MAKFDETAHWAKLARYFADGEKLVERAFVEALDATCPDWRESYEKMDANFDRIFDGLRKSMKRVKYMEWCEMPPEVWDRIVHKTFPGRAAEVEKEVEEDRRMMGDYFGGIPESDQ